MEEKETKGVGSFADTTDAKVEWQKVRRNVVEEIITLQRARVRLRQAQGILPLQCHSPAPTFGAGACRVSPPAPASVLP
jgi:hypothetical protein